MLSKEKIKLLKILLKELANSVTEEEHFHMLDIANKNSEKVTDPFLKELFKIYNACDKKIPLGIIYSCLKRKTIMWLWD